MNTPPNRSPWAVMASVLVGTYLVIMNATVLGVALPQIDADLGSSSTIDVDWVVTSYFVAVVMIQPATGWLADRFGRRRVYLASLAAFATGSMVAVLAPTMEVLLAGRVVQGLGGGALMPLAMAIVYGLFPPHRRGTALGIWGTALMAAPAFGPPFGGWAVTAASWRLVFVALLIVSVVGLVVAAWILPARAQAGQRSLDAIGWLLAAVAMPAIVILARNAPHWGFASPLTLSMALACTLLVAAFVVRSLRLSNPLIDVRVFTVRAFSISSVVLSLVTMTQFAVINFLPVELQVVRGAEAQLVGLLIAPTAVAAAATMPLGGWLADRVGARGPVTLGHILGASVLFGLSLLRPDTSLTVIAALLATQGIANGLSLMPTTVTAMNSLPGRFTSQASALMSLNRQLSGAIGVAVFAALLVATLGSVAPDGATSASAQATAQAGYNTVFAIAAGLRLVAAALSLALPGRRRMQQLHRDRAAEQEPAS